MEISIDNNEKNESSVFKESLINYTEIDEAHEQIKTLKKENKNNLIKLESIKNRINNLKKQECENRKKKIINARRRT